jgi:hypothetical protein
LNKPKTRRWITGRIWHGIERIAQLEEDLVEKTIMAEEITAAEGQ